MAAEQKYIRNAVITVGIQPTSGIGRHGMLRMLVDTLLVSLVAVHSPLRRECVGKAKHCSGGRSDKPNIGLKTINVGEIGHSRGCSSRRSQ